MLVKGTTIKGLCKATAAGAPTYDAGSDPPVSIVLTIGASPQRYCAECPNGGVQKGNPATLTKLKDCLAPASCPAGPPAATPTNTPTPLDTPTATHTHTETPTPTATEIKGPVCCEFGGVCGGEDADFCRSIFGTPVAGGTSCDASGACVAMPSSSGDCCEFTVPVSYCTMPLDQPTCAVNGGVYHANASSCDPSGGCVVCGDDVREGTEECDDADASACPGACRADCTCPSPCGATTGGFCWYLAADGESCDAVCANNGRTYDNATVTYSGSGGSDAQCQAVANALGVSGTVTFSGDCAQGFGCVSCASHLDCGIILELVRCSTPPTASNASLASFRRVCACH